MKVNLYWLLILFGIIFISGCANQSGEAFVIPLLGETQLGDLCTGNEECNEFCWKYSLDCEEYCRNNHENPTCQERFSFVLDDSLDPTLAPGYAKCHPTRGFDNYRTDRTFVIDPKDPKIMYVNVEYKGIYKSTDGGDTWKFTGNKGIRATRREDDQNRNCHGEYFTLTIDPKNSQRLLLPGGSSPAMISENFGLGGLYESTDGGESWHQLAKDWMNAYGIAAVFDPLDPATIYYSTSAHTTGAPDLMVDHDKILVTKGIVYKTTDNGKTWEELPTGFVPQLRGAELFMNPDDNNHMIVMGFALGPGGAPGSPARTLEPEQSGILFTKDGGKTWAQMTSLPEQYRAVSNGDYAPTNFYHMFVTTSGVPGIEAKSFYTLDGGETFHETSMAIAFARYDPHDNSGMRLLGYMIFPFEEAGQNIMESTDGGATWHVLGPWPREMKDEIVPVPDVEVTDGQKVRLSNIVFDPIDAKTIYLTGNFGYIWKSTDNGKTWTTILSVDKVKE